LLNENPQAFAKNAPLRGELIVNSLADFFKSFKIVDRKTDKSLIDLKHQDVGTQV